MLVSMGSTPVVDRLTAMLAELGAMSAALSAAAAAAAAGPAGPDAPPGSQARPVGDADRIEMLALLERVKSAAAALQARVTDAFARSQGEHRARVGDDPRDTARSVAAQVAFARRDSPPPREPARRPGRGPGP